MTPHIPFSRIDLNSAVVNEETPFRSHVQGWDGQLVLACLFMDAAPHERAGSLCVRSIHRVPAANGTIRLAGANYNVTPQLSADII